MRVIMFWLVQVALLASYCLAFVWAAPEFRQEWSQRWTGRGLVQDFEIPRVEPLRVTSLYDRPEMVSDEDLAAVLWQIRPRFERAGLRPNLVEHAIRAWSIKAEFDDEEVMSGQEMLDFLLDYGTYVLSWTEPEVPLLEDSGTGVRVNWGRYQAASVHHDHMLACVTEAGARLDTPVFLPSQREATLEDVLREALRDFRLDERETEWSAMAFGLWLPPHTHWQTVDGRHLSFDLIAERLLRGHLQKGVCSGTHRVYSLMLLWRLHQEHTILSQAMADRVYAHLEHVRDLITASQFEDGHWPSNWEAGARALEEPSVDELKDVVIATGHHLEWLAIAPEDLHPPREQIDKAAAWIIQTTKEQPPEKILQNYTFFSHVGNALALWRGTTPAHFWQRWRAEHPDYQFTPVSREHPPGERGT